MSIVISLSPEVEAQLREKAEHQKQNISVIASDLLTRILEWERQDLEEATVGIQQGLDNFETGNSRSFQTFAEEQRLKYNLPVDS